jgi:hypothetical protein
MKFSRKDAKKGGNPVCTFAAEVFLCLRRLKRKDIPPAANRGRNDLRIVS